MTALLIFALLPSYAELGMKGRVHVIITSLVEDVIMPPIGWLIGQTDFASLYLNLGSQDYESLQMAQAAGAPTINYGIFLNALIGFLLTVWIIFFCKVYQSPAT